VQCNIRCCGAQEEPAARELAELGAVTKPTVRLGVEVVGLLRFGGNGKPGYDAVDGSSTGT
jgi:hypothetical protein